MKYFNLFSSAIIFLLYSCRNNQPRTFFYESVDSSGIITKGHMDKDSNLFGEVQLIKNNVILERKFYSKGLSNGKVETYDDEGILKQISFDYYGIDNGPVMQFAKNGVMLRKQYNFWGKLIGPEILFDSLGIVKEYSFYNFENKVVFILRYLGNVIEENSNNVIPITFDSVSVDGVDKLRVFVYNISPPKYKYTYSICTLQSTDLSTLREIIKLRGDVPFFEEWIDIQNAKNICVKINIFDSILNKSKVLYNIYKN